MAAQENKGWVRLETTDMKIESTETFSRFWDHILQSSTRVTDDEVVNSTHIQHLSLTARKGLCLRTLGSMLATEGGDD